MSAPYVADRDTGERQPASERLRVLVVEDNPGDALMIRTFLTFGGAPVAVEHALCLRAALERLREAEFDVVLLDMILPDARDLEALEMLCREAPGVPVVVLTARNDEGMGLRAVRAGAQEYLSKGGLDPEVLLRSLRHSIERHRLRARLEVALARREAAEAALRSREERFRALIENASDVIAVVEADGTIRYLSPSIASVLGYRPEELEGTRGFELVHPEDRAELARCIVRARRAAGFSPAAEYRARHRDGSWRTLHAVASNQLANPAVQGLVVNSRDTTSRRQAELHREQALSLLHATLEATADGILVTDVAGRVAGYNRQFAAMWGLTEEALLGAADAGRMARGVLMAEVEGLLSDPEAFRARVAALDAEPEAEGFDVLELRDGRVFERYTKPQKIGGETVGRVWSFRDVTERRRLQARLLHSQKLEAVGQLAGGIAHDFNNILMTIKGTTALLLADVGEAAPFHGELEEIDHAAEHAARLTRQLLAFSRKQLMQPEVVDLNRTITRMGKMLQRVLGARIQIQCRLHSRLAPVWVDPGQIEQVILNLALNARDAMPDGGTLAIRTRNLEADDPRLAGCVPFPAGAVEVEVRDSGSGMDDATRARIFEPFFTTKGPGKGTGLGLSTVDGIVRQSGGDLLVECAPDAGTRFSVLLPAGGGDPAARGGGPEPGAGAREAEAGEGASGPGEAATVLLVEDTEPVRRLARRILERGSYRVLEAAGPEEGLRLAEEFEGTVDLLLSDVVMPGCSGPELAERFLRLRPGTPVVLMSGYSDDAAPLEKRDPAMRLIQKPFSPDTLLKAVAERLAAARAAAPGGRRRPGERAS